MGEIFHLLIYDPLYNTLVFLVSVLPFADVGLAVIVLTLFVKLVLFPLSIKAVKTQLSVRTMEPELTALKEKYKNKKEELARQTMALYKKHGVNPLSNILLIFIQLPIIFGLYWVFSQAGLPEVNPDILYSFTPLPDTFNMQFFWIDDISGRSIVLALLAGITQYFQIKLTLPPLKERVKNPSLKDDLARSFNLQMRYVMPFIVVGVAFVISAAIALYWTTSNLFMIGQEFFVRRKIKNRHENHETDSPAQEEKLFKTNTT